jgi:hypothetical protein
MVTIAEPEGCTARTIRGRGYGFDVVIEERRRPHGVHIKIKLQGIKLTRKQHRELARQLSIWKYGVSQVSPEQASPFAQATGLPEYEVM